MKKFSGTREAFAAAMTDMAREGKKNHFVSPDSVGAMRSIPFAKEFPNRYIEVGIAEQASVNVAAGLASCGLVPFVGTYAGFLTMRACEQMRTFVAYPNLNVKFVGINAGLVGGEREGVTHQFYEDLGVLSSIPGFTIFTPADAIQTYLAVKMAYEIEGPVYIRAGSGREMDVYDESSVFNKEGVTLLRNYGSDIVVFASGFILDRVLKAAEILKDKNVNISVADVNILHGKSPNKIIELITKAKVVFTVEDHNINGGLGSYISQLACEHSPKNVYRIGLTTFGKSGPAKELADSFGYSPEELVNKIRNKI